MRYQHARVVLAACLAAAAAAAQAPSSFDGFQVAGMPTVPRGGPRTDLAIGNDPPPPPAARPANPARATRFAQQQQGPDYTPRGMFLQQHGDFLNGMERYEPMISLRSMAMPSQHIQGEPGSFDIIGYGADASLPFNVSSDGYLLFGAYYEGRSYKFSSDSGLNDEYLHAGGVKIGFGGFLDDNLLFEIESHPGVFTDGDGGLHHQDYDFPSHLLFTWRTVEHFFLKMGVRYNQIYEDAPWLPYLGFGWNITGATPASGGGTDAGAWRLDVLLPEKAEVSYWSSASLGWMFGVEVRGAEYHVRTSAATGNQEDNLHIQEIISYLGTTWRMSDAMSLGARAGAVLSGDYHLTNGFTGFNKVEGALDQGFFADISFGFDF
jgi:hypothetical protein